MLGYPVSTAQELLADPQLKARDFGRRWNIRISTAPSPTRRFARFSEFPCRIRRPAPLIGEHNREIYGELGLDDGEMARLRNEGII